MLSQNRTKRAAASKQPYSLYRFIFIDDKALSASYKSKPCSTAEKPPTGRFFWQVRNAYPSRGIFSCKIPLCFNPNFGLKHSPPNAPDDKGVSHSAECDQSFTLDWTTFEKVDKTFVRLRRKVDENFNFCTNYLLLRRSRILFFWADKYGTYFVLFSMQRKGNLLERIFRAGDLGRVVVDHFNLLPAQCFYVAVSVDLQIGGDGADDLLHVV